jgi:hypothetical protein
MVSKESQEVEAIKFKDTKLVISNEPDYDLFFIARTKAKEKEKNIRKDLRKISEFFINEYRSQLIEWDGETVVFEKFRYRLTQYW